MSGQPVPDDLCMLLEFALARGSLGSIISVLRILFGTNSTFNLISNFYLSLLSYITQSLKFKF